MAKKVTGEQLSKDFASKYQPSVDTATEWLDEGFISGGSAIDPSWALRQEIADLKVVLWFAGCFIVGALAGVVVSLL